MSLRISKLLATITFLALFTEIYFDTEICLIPKNGDFIDVSNNRPIAIICEHAKLLGIILYDSVHSSISHLDSKGQVDVIYTNQQKAFDIINLNILSTELEKMGLRNSLLNLILC